MEGKTEYSAGETLCPYKKFLVSNRKPISLFYEYFVTTCHSICTRNLPLYVGVYVHT